MSEMSKNEKMARKDPLVQRLSADLGSRLLEVRTSEGLSQTTLAEMVGTSILALATSKAASWTCASPTS